MTFDIKGITIENLIKLYKKGKIDKVYSDMYNLAEQLAIHETASYEIELINPSEFQTPKTINERSSRLLKYKKERIEHHINRMIELLKSISTENKT